MAEFFEVAYDGRHTAIGESVFWWEQKAGAQQFAVPPEVVRVLGKHAVTAHRLTPAWRA